MKTQKVMKRAVGVHFHTARYWFDVVLYPANLDPEEHPHDWEFSFTKKEWRKFGMKVPPKNGSIEVVMQIGAVHGC